MIIAISFDLYWALFAIWLVFIGRMVYEVTQQWRYKLSFYPNNFFWVFWLISLSLFFWLGGM